jgi:hypothetical protein
MLYWECKRRLATLQQFRILAFDYFQNVRYLSRQHALRGQASMNDKAQKARHEMNQLLNDVVLSVDLLGVAHVIRWTPPPMIGGYIQNVDIFGNIFGLSAFEIPSQSVFDCLDRAIGAYERHCHWLLRQCFNPLYWAAMLFAWLLRLPFKLVGAAGFNATKAEESELGKALKLIWGLALGVAAFIPAVLETADHWSKVQSFLDKCSAALHRL